MTRLVSSMAPYGVSVRYGFGTYTNGHWPTTAWRPLADTSPLNRKVPSNPSVLANSAAMVAETFGYWDGTAVYILQGPDTSSDFGHPVYWSAPADAWFLPSTVAGTGGNAGSGNADLVKVQIPAGAKRAGGSDGHLIVIDQVAGIEHDFWQVTPGTVPAGGTFGSPTTLPCNWATQGSILGSGVLPVNAGANAADTLLSAGPIRAAEITGGLIPHALYMFTGKTANSFVYPATGLASVGATSWSDGVGNGTTTFTSATAKFNQGDVGLAITGTGISGGTTIVSVNVNTTTIVLSATATTGSSKAFAIATRPYPPDGQWFQCTYTYGQIAALPIHAWLKTILTAAKDYGMYVLDTGGSTHPIELLFESGSTYTSFSAADPIMTYAAAHEADSNSGISHSSSPLVYFFDMMTGVDWAGHLRALSPPSQ